MLDGGGEAGLSGELEGGDPGRRAGRRRPRPAAEAS
jgi:hypothetical protein